MKENLFINDNNSNNLIFIKSTNSNLVYLFFSHNNNNNKIEFANDNNFYIKNKPEKEFMIYFKAYKNAPQCILIPLYSSNCEKIKNTKNANLIWKLYQIDKMSRIISRLNKFQKYNHFPKTFQLGRKDNLWKNYKKAKKLFPTDYNFMPQTFILPQDSKNLLNFINKNSDCTFISKPVAGARGQGVKLIAKNEDIDSLILKSKPSLISKYIDKPHIINDKKYDLRIYVLITSFTPLKIYLYKEGLVRFASENYTQTSKNNIFVHLTNYAINKQNLCNNEAIKWSLEQYIQYFKVNKLENECCNIFKRIEEIIIKTILTIAEETAQNVRLLTKNRNSLFELYGFDILVDEKFTPWLLEVNVNPSLNCSTELDLTIKSGLIKDIINVIGIVPYSHEDTNKILIFDNKIASLCLNNNDNNNPNFSKIKVKICKEFDTNKPNFEFTSPYYSLDPYKEIINEYEDEQMRVSYTLFHNIFPRDQGTVKYYTKFVKNLGDDNIVLWKYIYNKYK